MAGTSRGVKGRGRARLRYLFPISSPSGQCFMAVAISFHNYSFCQKVPSLEPFLLSSWDSAPSLCLFRSGVIMAPHSCGSPGASWSPVNPGCTTIAVPSLIDLSQIVSHQPTDIHLCVYTWIKNQVKAKAQFCIFIFKWKMLLLLYFILEKQTLLGNITNLTPQCISKWSMNIYDVLNLIKSLGKYKLQPHSKFISCRTIRNSQTQPPNCQHQQNELQSIHIMEMQGSTAIKMNDLYIQATRQLSQIRC